MKTRRSILASLALSYATFAGCKSDPVKPATQPAATQAWTVRPVPVPGGAPITPVKSGLPPIAYLVEAGATVRIVEVETGRMLVEQPVQTRTVIGIIKEKGITFDGTVIVRGPMTEGMHYAIYVVADATSERMMRGEPTSRRSQD